MFEQFWQDLRQGTRMLAKNPGILAGRHPLHRPSVSARTRDVQHRDGLICARCRARARKTGRRSAHDPTAEGSATGAIRTR